MAWRLIIRSCGGPEVIEREAFEPDDPGPGEVLIAQEAVGLNFIDTYVRSGLYPAPAAHRPWRRSGRNRGGGRQGRG